MKVIDIIRSSTSPILSFEITPPERGHGIEEIFRSIDVLMPFQPQFINVTYHQPQVEYVEEENVIRRLHKRKKPGTVGICTAIKHKYKVEPVPHLICGGFTKYETEDALIDLQYLGIENLLALRGDPPPGQKKFIPEADGHHHAAGLVEQIARMNRGIYLEPLENAVKTDFCVGVAGYPERHFEAPNFERGMQHLKHKVAQGADYVVTQMFFDYDHFVRFREFAREIGITVPILPGIKPVSRLSQLDLLPSLFHVSIPDRLIRMMEEARTRQEEREAGTRYMAGLLEQLLQADVPGIHIYTMGKALDTRRVLDRVFGTRNIPSEEKGTYVTKKPIV
jgi:methylenetetrahydrofolate reductase (NADPH)